MGQQQGYAEVEINGERKLLRFDFNAIADVEEYFGTGIASIMREERVGFSTIRALYWGGLKWKMKGLTIERAGAMLQKEIEEGRQTISELMQPIAVALKASGFMGNNNDDEAEEAEPEDGEGTAKN